MRLWCTCFTVSASWPTSPSSCIALCSRQGSCVCGAPASPSPHPGRRAPLPASPCAHVKAHAFVVHLLHRLRILADEPLFLHRLVLTSRLMRLWCTCFTVSASWPTSPSSCIA